MTESAGTRNYSAFALAEGSLQQAMRKAGQRNFIFNIPPAQARPAMHLIYAAYNTQLPKDQKIKEEEPRKRGNTTVIALGNGKEMTLASDAQRSRISLPPFGKALGESMLQYITSTRDAFFAGQEDLPLVTTTVQIPGMKPFKSVKRQEETTCFVFPDTEELIFAQKFLSLLLGAHGFESAEHLSIKQLPDDNGVYSALVLSKEAYGALKEKEKGRAAAQLR